MPRGASAGLLAPRVWGALRLRPETFREVAADESAGVQAGILVIVIGVLEATVSAASHHEPTLQAFDVVYAVLAALIGWMVWAGILYGVASGAFDLTCEVRPVQRAVAFAHAPGLVYGLAAIPGAEKVTGLLFLASLVWFALALVATVRGVFDVPLSRASGITAIAMVAHEVLRQALRALGLVG